MLVLIASQIAAAQQSANTIAWLNGEAKTFAGDGVDCSRCISDQSYVAAADALQLAGGGQCAFLD